MSVCTLFENGLRDGLSRKIEMHRTRSLARARFVCPLRRGSFVPSFPR